MEPPIRSPSAKFLISISVKLSDTIHQIGKRHKQENKMMPKIGYCCSKISMIFFSSLDYMNNPQRSLWKNLHQKPSARWPQAPQMSIYCAQHSGTESRIHISSWHVRALDGAFMTKINGCPWITVSICKTQNIVQKDFFFTLTCLNLFLKLALKIVYCKCFPRHVRK